jgi:hypothetical protein
MIEGQVMLVIDAVVAVATREFEWFQCNKISRENSSNVSIPAGVSPEPPGRWTFFHDEDNVTNHQVQPVLWFNFAAIKVEDGCVM